jgi:predicted RNase H-like HicB family nuclease
MRRITADTVGQELHGHFTPAARGVSICAMIVPLKKVQLRQDEDGVWIAKSNLLPGCHAHGRDRGEALLRFQQAAKAHLEALLETGRPIPPAFRDKFILAA